jgi:hypothetical protein
LTRADRAAVAERIAMETGMQLRGFDDYAEALDWLSDPTGSTGAGRPQG